MDGLYAVAALAWRCLTADAGMVGAGLPRAPLDRRSGPTTTAATTAVTAVTTLGTAPGVVVAGNR